MYPIAGRADGVKAKGIAASVRRPTRRRDGANGLLGDHAPQLYGARLEAVRIRGEVVDERLHHARLGGTGRLLIGNATVMQRARRSEGAIPGGLDPLAE